MSSSYYPSVRPASPLAWWVVKDTHGAALNTFGGGVSHEHDGDGGGDGEDGDGGGNGEDGDGGGNGEDGDGWRGGGNGDGGGNGQNNAILEADVRFRDDHWYDWDLCSLCTGGGSEKRGDFFRRIFEKLVQENGNVNIDAL